MFFWRRRYVNTIYDTESISNYLLGVLSSGDKEYGNKLIKLGVTIFFIPIIGISEVIGALLIGLGLLIRCFSSKSYPISQLGKDLDYSIKYIKSVRDSISIKDLSI
jgi:hypothetical protein